MADMFDVEIYGAQELANALRRLPAYVVAKVINKAGLKAAGPTLETARMHARKHQRTGWLAKLIRASVPPRRGRAHMVRLGVKSQWVYFRKTEKTGRWRKTTATGVGKWKSKGYGTRRINPAKYAHLLELGRGPGGWHKAAVPGYPFMRPAYLQHAGRMVREMQENLWRGVANEIAKQRMRSGGLGGFWQRWL
jgi:hypothetical protein